MNDTEPEDLLPKWKQELLQRLPLFGHRNWIVIADSAYPLQSAAGISTITANADQLTVVREALALIADSEHVEARTYVDRELDFVDERYARGITAYRQRLAPLLRQTTTLRLPHDEIIDKLDKQARVFSILIIKTSMTLPYTSVFIELQCGYWEAAAEECLRSAMSSEK